MFPVHCPTLDQTVLLSTRHISRFENRDGVILVELQCHENELITHVTGRRRQGALAAV